MRSVIDVLLGKALARPAAKIEVIASPFSLPRLRRREGWGGVSGRGERRNRAMETRRAGFSPE